ncbi:hypothetical protein SESBI_08148 [Sesbania bispinosa]|nr:hypothetical protein SESBI_08148 [Sesbania bispinosa]
MPPKPQATKTMDEVAMLKGLRAREKKNKASEKKNTASTEVQGGSKPLKNKVPNQPYHKVVLLPCPLKRKPELKNLNTNPH